MNAFDGLQLDMLEGAEVERRAPALAWSYSRREMLEQCPRRYYYLYYGSVVNEANREPLKEKLKFLKGLSNRYMWAGKVLHSMIRRYLLKLRRGQDWNLGEFLNQASSIYWSGPKNSPVSGPSEQSAGLLECYYGMTYAKESCAQCEERLLAGLHNLATGPSFAPLLRGGVQPEARIEERAGVEIGRFKANGKVDLVYPSETRIVIVDWKLGGPGSADESLQLSFYALWATQKYRCLPQTIGLCRAYLSDNSIESFSVSDKALRRTRARIIQDMEKMRFLHSYGTNAMVEAFPSCSEPRVCALCPFQTICLKEP